MAEDVGATVVRPGEGLLLTRLNGERTVVKVGQAATRGAYAVRENTVPAGFSAVPLHVHRNAEEAFYVLDGELAVLAGGHRTDAAAGSFVLIPRGVTHAIANVGRRPVRWLTLFSPAAQSEWIEAEHELLTATPGEPDPLALAAIHRRFGLEIVGSPPQW